MSEERRPSTFAALRDLLAKHDARRRPLPPGTVGEAVVWAEKELDAAAVDAPRLSAELLAAQAFGLSRLGLIMRAKDKPSDEQQETFRALVARRAQGEPAAYILGVREFFGLPFAVTPSVLIPRPETECMVEEAQRLFPKAAPVHFADFGTGSGALAVTLAHEFPTAHGLAVDLSGHALEMARQNARANAVEDRLEFRCADFTSLELEPGSLDLVVANPPYVTEAEYAGLSHEVRGFEPREALVSAEEGLAHLRGLLPVAMRALKPGGWLLCEHGSAQGPGALALAQSAGLPLDNAETLRDYAGLDRILKARKSLQNSPV